MSYAPPFPPPPPPPPHHRPWHHWPHHSPYPPPPPPPPGGPHAPPPPPPPPGGPHAPPPPPPPPPPGPPPPPPHDYMGHFYHHMQAMHDWMSYMHYGPGYGPHHRGGPGGPGRRHHGFGVGPGYGHGWWGGHHGGPAHRGGWHRRRGGRPRGPGGEPSVMVSTWRTDNTVMTRVVREGDSSRMSYTAKIAQELALQVIQSEEVNPSETEVLDFGFESGEFNTSIVLQPHVKSVVGAAVSASAVGAYNDHATRGHVSPDAMQAIALPFMGHLSSLKGKLFDVIVVSQPIDQRPDIAGVLPALAAQFLKPGGALFVAVLDMNKSAAAPGAGGDAEGAVEEEAYEDQRVQAIFHDAALEGFELIANDAYGAGTNEPGRLFFAVGYKPVPEDFDLVDDDMSTASSAV